MIYFLKKSFYILVLFFFLPYQATESQEKKVIKKIIIDSNSNKRLLNPSVENKNNPIKLIKPKSAADTESENKKIKEVQKAQDKKSYFIKDNWDLISQESCIFPSNYIETVYKIN